LVNDSKPTGSEAAAATLTQQIAEATGWAIALGALGVVASLFQIFGVIELGVPGWFNLSIALAVIVLGLTLNRRSLVLTGLLAAIFVAIAVDTLVATGILFESGGWPLAIVILIRYSILLAALRSFAAVFKGVLDLRRATVNEGALDPPTPSGVQQRAVSGPTASASRVPPRLALGTSPSAILFGVLAGFLALAGGILLLALPLEGPVPLLLLLLLGIAAAAGWASYAEQGHVPKLIDELRHAVARGDRDEQQKALHWLGRVKTRGARALAIAALEAQPNDSDATKAQGELRFACAALEAIAAIGSLDRDAAQAILRHFVPSRCETRANGDSWQAACAAARAALTSVGYSLTPNA
jgi:hypothetical protein